MCWLCHLRANSDVLVSIWQQLSLRTKLCQLTRLSRCAHIRQSLLQPAAYVYNEVHIEHTLVSGDDIGQSIAAVRLPAPLPHIRTLCVLLSPPPHTSPPSTFDAHKTHSSPSAQVTEEEKGDSAAAERRPKRQRTMSVSLALLTHLKVLACIDVQCVTEWCVRRSVSV